MYFFIFKSQKCISIFKVYLHSYFFFALVNDIKKWKREKREGGEREKRKGGKTEVRIMCKKGGQKRKNPNPNGSLSCLDPLPSFSLMLTLHYFPSLPSLFLPPLLPLPFSLLSITLLIFRPLLPLLLLSPPLSLFDCTCHRTSSPFIFFFFYLLLFDPLVSFASLSLSPFSVAINSYLYKHSLSFI